MVKLDIKKYRRKDDYLASNHKKIFDVCEFFFIFTVTSPAATRRFLHSTIESQRYDLCCVPL